MVQRCFADNFRLTASFLDCMSAAVKQVRFVSATAIAVKAYSELNKPLPNDLKRLAIKHRPIDLIRIPKRRFELGRE